MMDFLHNMYVQLTSSQLIIHGCLFAINFLLFCFAKPIVTWSNDNVVDTAKTRIFQFINITLLGLHILDILLISLNSTYEHYLIRLGASLVTIYVSLFFSNLSTRYTKRRFGKSREIDDNIVYFDTYHSRLIEIVFLALLCFISIYILIKIWGADSLLETTGIIGIAAAFLAFTSGVWAPDIISGLIILNTKMLEDGDLVIVDGYPDEYIINRVSFIYTTLFDVRNNHRTLIRNSRFIKSKIDNISRMASTDGVRQVIHYQIGYHNTKGLTQEERIKQHHQFKTNIDKMFETAEKECLNNNAIKINRNKAFEWSLTQTGNYALEYSLWIYLERLPNTKVTATARKHFIGSVFKINEAVYDASIIHNIELATPDIVSATVKRDKAT